MATLPSLSPHEKQWIESPDDGVESMQNRSSATTSMSTRTNIPSLTCAFLASVTTGGTTYAFGLYGAALKESLGLSQSELDTISSANFCAGLLSWIPGLCVDRFGSKSSMSVGGILGALSLVLYWAVAKSILPVTRTWIVPTLSMLGVCIFLSNATVIGSIFKILVSRCEPRDRGTAVGISKGFVGLGAGAYATIFLQLRTISESDLDFLLMAAFFNVMAATVPALLLLPSKQTMDELNVHKVIIPDAVTPLHFRTLYASLTGLAALIIGHSLLELYQVEGTIRFQTEDDRHRHFGMASLIVAVWILPILCLMILPLATSMEQQLALATESNDDDNSNEVTEATTLIEEPPDYGAISHKHVRLATIPENSNVTRQISEQKVDCQQQRTLPQMLSTLPAWLFLWTATILVGGGIVITNNMGQMVQSLHFPEVAGPSALALFSVAQALTRVATGALSDAAMTSSSCCGVSIRGGIPRPAFLILASLAGFISHFILALSRRLGPFVLGVFLSGAAFGMIWPLMVLIVGEVFGNVHVGANYMFYDGFTCAAGTLLLSKFVAQHVYESHIKDGGDGVTCYGMGCFQISHFVVAGLSLTCIGTSIGVLLTTRNTYHKGPTVASLHTGIEPPGAIDSSHPSNANRLKPTLLAISFARSVFATPHKL